MNRLFVALTTTLISLLPHINALSQSSRCVASGFVRDALSGETLPGAVVWSSLGYVAANSHGFYSLPVLPRKDTLTVSYVGYRQERIVVSESVDFRQDIILLPGEELEEAVVSAAT